MRKAGYLLIFVILGIISIIGIFFFFNNSDVNLSQIELEKCTTLEKNSENGINVVFFADKKEQAELFMITDLLRNDLSRIESPLARVVAKKKKLLVPGLVHQYSLLSVPLSINVSLGQVIKAMFPGGSVTGAPKLRVMKILYELERGARGYYTGSTVLLHHSMRAVSINIRSADVDFKKKIFTVGAGSGITLLSEVKKEYEEMLDKVRSFITLLC